MIYSAYRPGIGQPPSDRGVECLKMLNDEELIFAAFSVWKLNVLTKKEEILYKNPGQRHFDGIAMDSPSNIYFYDRFG